MSKLTRFHSRERREQRRAEAAERAKARNKLSAQEQLEQLANHRPGKSGREVARLERQVPAEHDPKDGA